MTLRTWNEANLLETVKVKVRGASTETTYVSGVEYNARGQRAAIDFGNGVRTDYTYDPETFRLTRTRTTRNAGATILQDLTYEIDPVGNIVQVSDAVDFANTGVDATGVYEYDALYQLMSAEGREHPGQQLQQPTDADANWRNLADPNDMTGLARYVEAYVYDAAGNILQMSHAPLPSGTGWTRRYDYQKDAQQKQLSNRLVRTSLPSDTQGTYSAQYADSGQADHSFRAMPITDSGHGDHPGRCAAG